MICLPINLNRLHDIIICHSPKSIQNKSYATEWSLSVFCYYIVDYQIINTDAFMCKQHLIVVSG